MAEERPHSTMTGQLRLTVAGELGGEITDVFGFVQHIRGVPTSPWGKWDVTATVTVPPDLRLPWEDGPDEPEPGG